MKLRAYAKINLGLDVLGKRADGYHEVKMIMQTVDIWDQLTFTRSAKPGIMLQIAGAELPAGRDNLICKAAELVMREMNLNEGVEIELVKKIPIAAGMAGGMPRLSGTRTKKRRVWPPVQYAGQQHPLVGKCCHGNGVKRL